MSGQETLNPVSSDASKAVLTLAYATVVAQGLSDLFVLSKGFETTGVTLVIAIVATLAARRGSGLAQDLIALCLVGQVIVLTASYQGHVWQIDTHMVYFVMLAGISTLGSVRALLVGAAATAVHHLGLTILLPALVYPSVDLFQNLMRTGIHGTVVVFETGILALSLLRRNRMMAQIADQTENLSDQSHRAEVAEAKARKMVLEAESAVDVLRNHLHHLADRNLDCRIETEMPDSFEDLRCDFNLAVDRLEGALVQAQNKAQSFDGEARLLDQVIDHLASGTKMQASDLGSQSQTIEALCSRLNESATQVDLAVTRVTAAREEADHGGAITKEAVAAMARIEKSSGEVGNIMDLIDDIAFQTNLLALNAGVEAARAGSSGRGFAVVAGEVQALSQRTAEAARGVKELISSSEAEVASGAKLVNEAGQRLSSIVEQVNEVSGIITSIRADATVRSEEMISVSQKMSDLDVEAQKILGQSSEMFAAGHRLKGHAHELSTVMSEFHLNMVEGNSLSRAG